MSLTRDLADFCSTLRYADVPAAALPFVRTGFTDCFATLVAGRHSEPATMLRDVLEPPPGECAVFVDQGTARAHEAALLNATAAHALDFDDAAQRGHLSVVMVPAILAEAEALGADGRRMVTAYAAGYETWAALIGREPDHYHHHSWHPTGVFGPLAVAAACASLRGLDAARAAHALAIAASQSAGLIANFGSMTKPLHAGRAAQAGVLAARLAERGFTGSSGVLEDPKGLMRGLSPKGRVDVETPTAVGRDWALPRGGVNTKKYPTCFATHRALDGMLALIAAHAPEPAEVARVRVTTSRRNRSTLRFERPDDALQARFSMQFAMAAALLVRRCGLRELSDGFVRRRDVQALMQRVEVQPTDAEDPARPGEAPRDAVEIETVDGRRLRTEVAHVRGGPEHPLHPGELFAKFEDCLAYGGLQANPRPLHDALMALDELPGTAAIYALAAG